MSMNWKPVLESLEARETPAVVGLKGGLLQVNLVILAPPSDTAPAPTAPAPTSPAPAPTSPVVVVTPPATPWTP